VNPTDGLDLVSRKNSGNRTPIIQPLYRLSYPSSSLTCWVFSKIFIHGLPFPLKIWRSPNAKLKAAYINDIDVLDLSFGVKNSEVQRR
jgi:hypothetical protein